MNKIYFISGVNGVGKSTIIPHLKSLLSKEEYAIYDFDQRGVPENANRDWRISETRYWINKGNGLAKDGISTIICGFIKPTDLQDYDLSNSESNEIVLILLYAEPEIIRQRLTMRYTKDGYFDENQKVIGKPIDVFIDGNVWFAGKMKEDFEKQGYVIINTSFLTPTEVAEKASRIILKD